MAGGEIMTKAFDKALSLQSPLARKNIERLRRVHPDDGPAELLERVTKFYLRGVTGTGAAAGGASAVPGLGIGTGLAAGSLDAISFLEASTLYVLSVAEIHGLHPEDLERRKLLVQTVLIGDSAISTLNKGADKVVKHWAKKIVDSIPLSAINRANKVLGPRFVTRYGTRAGTLVLSKQVPIVLGIATGAAANHLVGRGIVKSTRKVFGPPPPTFQTVAVAP